jgi:hypothetical protein
VSLAEQVALPELAAYTSTSFSHAFVLSGDSLNLNFLFTLETRPIVTKKTLSRHLKAVSRVDVPGSRDAKLVLLALICGAVVLRCSSEMSISSLRSDELVIFKQSISQK